MATYDQIVSANRATFEAWNSHDPDAVRRPAGAAGWGRVRRVAPIVALLACLATAAPAAARQSISASPNPVHFGQQLIVKGKGWPVIEFCSRTVRLSLRSDQNAFRIGKVRVGDHGRFRFAWVPRRSKVGAGRWTVVARMRCESGKDGSPVPTAATAPIRIRR